MGLVWGNNLRENSRKHLKRTEAVGKGEEGSSHSVHESESKPRQTKFSVAALCPLCVFFPYFILPLKYWPLGVLLLSRGL